MAETLKVDKPQGTGDVKSADEEYLLKKGWIKDLVRAHAPHLCWFAPWQDGKTERRKTGQYRAANGRMVDIYQTFGRGLPMGRTIEDALESQRARDKAEKAQSSKAKK